MKKITFTAILILIAGMLVGCASTANISNKNDKLKPDTYTEQISYKMGPWEKALWDRFDLNGMLRNYGPGHHSDDEREYQALKNKCFEILNSPEMSIYDWYVLRYIWKENPDYIEKFHKKYGTRDDWFEEFLKDKELENNNFTGKIINNSDDTMHIRLTSRRDYEPIRCFHIEIPAHEEKYFTIPDVKKLDNTRIVIEAAVSDIIFWAGVLGVQSREERSNYSKYCQYVFSNYSFELTYNDYEQTHNSEDFLPGNSEKYSKNWRLVHHYEMEGSVCKEADYRSLNKYFGVSAK